MVSGVNLAILPQVEPSIFKFRNVPLPGAARGDEK